jgi:hypothetical protein
MTPEQLSHVATTAGVLFAAYQILLSRQQAQTSFEDALAKEYRELSMGIPTKAFLGEALTEAEYEAAKNDFYHYFDLSNSQAFLRQINRVSPKTWKYWADGMKSNLRRPAFKMAWERISSQPNGDFAELRLLIAQNYEIDPKSKKWKQLIGNNS